MALPSIADLIDKLFGGHSVKASHTERREITINPHHVNTRTLEHIAKVGWEALLERRKLPSGTIPFRGSVLQGIGPVFNELFDRYKELVSAHRRRARFENPKFDALDPVDCLIFTIVVFDEIEMDDLFDLDGTARQAGVSTNVLNKEIRTIIILSCIDICFEIMKSEISHLPGTLAEDVRLFVIGRVGGQHARYRSDSSNNRLDRIRPVLKRVYASLPARKNRIVRVG